MSKLAISRHHTAYFVFGKPDNPKDPKYEQRLANHEKYKARYEALQWMMEGLEDGPLMYDWGRR